MNVYNKNPNDPIIVQDWIELVDFIGKNLVTKDEITPLKEDVSTLKEDVSTIKADMKSLKTDVFNIKEEVRVIVENSEQRIMQMTSDIFQAKDEILGEVRAMRQEQKMHAGLHGIITDESEHLKKRVTKIETHVGIDPARA